MPPIHTTEFAETALATPTTTEAVVYYNQAQYPGKILAPVQLTGPAYGGTLDTNGPAFGCQRVENATRYQLLFGSDPDRDYLAAGLTIYLVLQSLVIIGGNLGVLPLTGVTLPFVSYGGSSLLTSFLSLFLILLVSSPIARAEDAISFGLDWLAEAEILEILAKRNLDLKLQDEIRNDLERKARIHPELTNLIRDALDHLTMSI